MLAVVAIAHADTLLAPDADFALVDGLRYAPLTASSLDELLRPG